MCRPVPEVCGMILFNNCFDDLTDGLCEGVVTHIYGPPASGKTNLALIATANALGQGKVVYIDPEGGFSAARLKQISGEKFEDVLNNTLLVEPTTFDEQKLSIARLDEVITSMKISLVVVDSIAMLYRMEEDKDVRMLGRILAQLLRAARKYNLPVLLTNQVYSEYDTNRIRPIGGQISEYFTKNVVELCRRDDNSRYAVVRRHMTKPEGLTVEFKITRSGVKALNECRLDQPTPAADK
ncbi:MAG: DNA repair and recombination protein RadB [Candidatus Altiarchaeales archaeon]|nr:DNA repair and recombination protein RadB [Candidatus Altiarchaeales archaeon]MBD3416639.1 DNA repair and recombination protein RadB [Candidatus Altiarchaeales archaeon]